MNNLRLGMIGLDTSHVPEFATLLHETRDPHHIPGAKICAAFPGGSQDFELSTSRVSGFTETLRKRGVEIVGSIRELAPRCDAVMLMSIDGRVHAEQFREVASWGVPVFIDKPLAVSSADARSIMAEASRSGTRVFSASALRFAESFRETLRTVDGHPVQGADFSGPMALQDKCPGYFWYGIHTAEMLFAALGRGCRQVLAVRDGDHDIAIGRWADGRFGTLRGCRTGNHGFGGTLHGIASSTRFDALAGKKPLYATLLDEIISFFKGSPSPVEIAESAEVISFLEAANRSVSTGNWEAVG